MDEFIDDIFGLFSRWGAGLYGEEVSLQAHMLQTAARAEEIGASPALVAAALLHDVGHLLHPESEGAVQAAIDLEHEALGAVWLSRAFGPEITAPIALHVEAKRYLCAVDAAYHDRLSEASRASLLVQGGVMSSDEVAAFEREPGFEQAITLRRCDDDGKDMHRGTKPLQSYRELLAGLIKQAKQAK